MHYTACLLCLVMILCCFVSNRNTVLSRADYPRIPRPGGGLMGVKGPRHGVKGKGAHGNEIATLLLESDD